jgi:hypothetical protein
LGYFPFSEFWRTLAIVHTMKCLAVVAIVIVGLVQQPSKAPAPASSPQAQTNSGGQHSDDAERTVGISKLPPVSVTRDWADWGVWVFSFLLVVVGVLQVWLLWRTLGAMKQQADLMKQQADIQEAALQQWVDVVTADAGGDNQKSLPNKLLAVNLGFKAVNNTSFMLTIKKIVTKVSFFAERSETFTITTSVSLPPSKGKESAYPFYVPLKLDAEHAELFANGTILTIHGEVGFEDCLRKNQVDEFGGLYKFSANVFEYMQPLGLVPEHKTANADH